MNYTIKHVTNRTALRDFLRVPFLVYRNDPRWVSPIISDLKRYLTGKEGTVFRYEHLLLVVYRDTVPVGRLAVGVDPKINEAHQFRKAFFTLYETDSDPAISLLLFQEAQRFAQAHSLGALRGPVSPTNGDDYRGLLIEGFEQAPYINTSYNPAYYQDHMIRCGFHPISYFLGFHYDLTCLNLENLETRIQAIRRRIQFEIRPADFRQTRKLVHDIHHIMAQSINPAWNYLMTPTEEELYTAAQKLKSFTFPSFIQVAYSGGQPIGFAAGLPDYNQILKDFRGSLFPFGWLHFFLKRRSINRGRAFLLFVLPEYQGRGLSRALLLELFRSAKRLNYQEAEGSSIDASNRKMCLEAVGAGGTISRKYALFEKQWGDLLTS